MDAIRLVEAAQLKKDRAGFEPGDTVRVHVKVVEGEKERIQVFEGAVIRRSNGGIRETFTVRKVSYGVGVERIFPVHGPVVEKIEIKSRGHVRRSRLYYLRDLSGKKARLRSKIRDLAVLIAPEGEVGTAAEAADAEAAAASTEETPS